MRKSVFLQSLLLSSAVLLFGVAQAQQVPGTVPAGKRAVLTERCLPVQFQHGRAAFRECINTLLDESVVEPPFLSFNERYAVARACADAGDRDACVRRQSLALADEPRANLAALGMEATQAIEQRCLDAIEADAAAYRQCLKEESSLSNRGSGNGVSAASGSSATLSDDAVGDNTSSTGDARNGSGSVDADDPLSSRTGELTSGAAPADADASASQGSADTEPTRPANANVTAGNAASGADSNGSPTGSDTSASDENRPDYLETLEAFDVRTPMEKLSDALDELGRYSKLALGILVIAGGLILLLLLYGLLRRRESLEPGISPMARWQADDRTSIPDDSDDAMFDSLEQSLDEMSASASAQSQTLDDTRRSDRHDDLDYLELTLSDRQRPQPELDGIDETAVTRLAVNPLVSSSRNAEPRSEDQPSGAVVPTGQDRRAASRPVAAMAGFSHWLDRQAPADKRAICTEFLVYWIAYADERYDPALKRRLTTAGELNTVDRIKHWALGGDPASWASAVAWLSQNATRLQLEQSVSLIMALLITERSVTPVQTVMLRLLADAFDIGNDALEAEFEESFAHPLPGMPRPDRLSWWNQQSRQTIELWSGSERAEDSTHRRSRELLGLGAEVRDIDVIKAYRRAARRCHPDRFAALGSRERGLAVRQFDRFEQARDRLLGVLA